MISQTLLLIMVTTVISFMAFNRQDLFQKLVLYPPAVNQGQYYRLLTSGFIHADIMHLAFNMITLWFFGRAIEAYINSFWPYAFLVFYLVALIISDLPSYFKNKQNTHYASLGASGGVAAVLFAFIMQAPWQTIYVFIIPVPAILFAVAYLFYAQYMSHKGGDRINHDAHFWGAIYGVVAVCLIDSSTIPRFIESIQHPQFNF